MKLGKAPSFRKALAGAKLLRDVTRLAGVVCSSCGKVKTNPIDKEAIKNLGECLACDHLRTDQEFEVDFDEARCTKCGEGIRADEDSLCGYCI